jgi:hypothetical protein
MKKLFMLFLLSSATGLWAQNIGVNTNTPQYPITMSSALGDKISFWGGDGAPNTNHYGIGVQGALLQMFTPPGGDIAFGTGRSAAFSENLRISSLGDVSSKGTFAGYTFYDRLDQVTIAKRFVWYNNGGAARLFSGTGGDVMAVKHNGFVGIGVADPLAKLHINGALRIADGSQGAGKVLTSDAAGNTSWEQAALSSPDRFMLLYDWSATTQPSQYMQAYETSVDISISTTTGVVTINKSGLYHFETNIEVSTVLGSDFSQSATAPELFKATMLVTSANAIINNMKFPLFRTPFLKENAATLCKGIGRGSIDIYLVAPATVKLEFATTNNRTLNAANFSDNYFSGYLISE